MERTYKNSHDAKQQVDPGVKSPLPSMTLQGETDDIRTLLKKHQAGQVIQQKKVHYIDAELDQIDKYHRRDLDLTDLEKLADHNKRIGDKIEEIKEAENQKKKQKELDEKIEAEIKRRKEEAEKSKPKDSE